MDTVCTWHDKLFFSAAFGPHAVPMDTKAPVGTDKAASPKQLVLAAITGCSAMDVISLLRKAKQMPETFTIDAHADVRAGQPGIFTKVELVYKTTGAVSVPVIKDAVHKSMTEYCSVSAMIAKCCPITYRIVHDGAEIGTGEANFAV